MTFQMKRFQTNASINENIKKSKDNHPERLPSSEEAIPSQSPSASVPEVSDSPSAQNGGVPQPPSANGVGVASASVQMDPMPQSQQADSAPEAVAGTSTQLDPIHVRSQVLVREHEASSHDVETQSTEYFSRRARSDLENEYLLVEALVCPVCSQRIRDVCPETGESNVIQCTNGHFLCQDCMTNMKFANANMQCPQCRVPLSRTVRNIFADMWLTLFYENRKVKCKFSEYGCKEYDELVAIANHQKWCIFREVRCPSKYSGCHWQDSLSKLMQHLSSMDHFMPTKILKFSSEEERINCNVALYRGRFSNVPHSYFNQMVKRCLKPVGKSIVSFNLYFHFLKCSFSRSFPLHGQVRFGLFKKVAFLLGMFRLGFETHCLFSLQAC